MALSFDPVWAVNGPVRAPTSGEQDEGFPCGGLDRSLFNFMFQDLQQAINALDLRAGQSDIPVKGWQNTPPVSPTIGDRYIVNTAPTGAWVGHAAEIAIWSGDAWVFRPAESALQVQFRRNGLQVVLEFDGTAWAEAGYVRKVAIGPTLYVRTDGNDANDGSANDSAHAFATIKAAVLYGTRTFFLVGQTLNIQLGNPGVYAHPGSVPTGTATVRIVGNTGAPSSYQIQGTADGAGYFSCTSGVLAVEGLNIINSTAGSQSIIAAGTGNLSVGTVIFSTTVGTVGNHMQASSGGNLTISAGCLISGNAGGALVATGGSKIFIVSTLAVVNGLIFDIFASADELSLIKLLVGPTVTGTAIGQRYSVNGNSMITVSGAGPNVFPGTIAGTTANGGLYV